MPHRIYNLTAGRRAPRALLALGLLAALLSTRVAVAETTAGQMMQVAGFRNIVFTIAMVNKAMREAAENPMDEWRRRNVQIAVSMMPNAIRGLAAEYLQFNMRASEFPMVQAMLGGFIDQSAPDNYKKFLANPSRHNIPKTGNDFPVVAAPAVPAPAGAPPAASGDGTKGTTNVAVSSSSPSSPASAPARPEELADLSDRVSEAVAAAPEAQGKGGADRINFDDETKKTSSAEAVAGTSGGAGGSASAAAGASYASVFGPVPSEPEAAATTQTAAQYQTQVMREASREISAIEAKVTPSDLTRILPGRRDREAEAAARDKEKESDEFFKGVGKDGKKKDARPKTNRERVEAGRAGDPGSFTLSVKPKFWRVTPLLQYVDKVVLGSAAHAQGDKKEGDGSGAQAIAQILFGVAAIIAAIAPMVVASIQAKADITIAKINADTQVTLTEITSKTSKDLAQMQKDVALTQSAIAQQISSTNNAAVTERLNLQLAELKNARNDARSAEKERRALEDSYNQQRIQLAQKQADDNLSLAKETLKAQLTQAGLTSGYGSSTNSGATLTASSALGVGGSIGGGTQPARSVAEGTVSGGTSASSGPSVATTSGTVPTSSTVGNLISKSTPSTISENGGVPNLGLGGRKDDILVAGSEDGKNGSVRLLAGLTNGGSTANANRRFDSIGADESEEVDTIDPRTGKAMSSRNGRRSGRRTGTAGSKRSARRSATVGGRLNQILLKPVATGSTAENKVTAGGEEGKRSDLQRFLSAGSGGNQTTSFTQFRETAGRPNGPTAGTTTAAADRPIRSISGGYAEGYNASGIERGGHDANQGGPTTNPIPFEIPKFLTGPETPQ